MDRIQAFGRTLSQPLVVKPIVLGLLWAGAPFWMFAVGALWAYFVPWFRVQPFLLHFAALLFLAERWDARGEGGALLSEAPFSTAWLFHLGAAIMIALFFTVLLGVKDLALLRRDVAEKILGIALFFFLSLEVFLLATGPGRAGSLLLFPLLAAIAIYFFRSETSWKEFPLTASVLLTEAGALLLFLPVAAAEKAAIFFILAVALFEFCRDGAESRTPFLTLLMYFAGVFFFSALVLLFAKWGI